MRRGRPARVDDLLRKLATVPRREQRVLDHLEMSPLRPGVDVEVRCRFDDRWTRGFEIASVDRDTYFLRRRSDGAVLPSAFGSTEIRPLAPSYPPRRNPRAPET